MKSRVNLVLLITFFLVQAQAGYLRLIPSVEIAPVDERVGFVRLVGTIENQGDEAAQDVKIEAVRSNKILTPTETLQAGEKKEINVEVSEKDLLIEKDGGYSIPLRVLYKDANRVGFSAAFILSYTKKGSEASFGRSSPISLSLDEDSRKNGGVDIAKSGELGLLLANTSSAGVDVSIELVSTKEVEFKIPSGVVNLAPGEQKEIHVEVKNVSALSGSSYATYAMIRGESEGQAFSDYIGFVVNVKSKAEFSFVTISLVLLALLFTVGGIYYYRRESKEATTET